MGKGSKQRPAQISDENFKEQWDQIFGPKEVDVICDCGERFRTADEETNFCPSCIDKGVDISKEIIIMSSMERGKEKDIH